MSNRRRRPPSHHALGVPGMSPAGRLWIPGTEPPAPAPHERGRLLPGVVPDTGPEWERRATRAAHRGLLGHPECLPGCRVRIAVLPMREGLAEADRLFPDVDPPVSVSLQETLRRRFPDARNPHVTFAFEED